MWAWTWSSPYNTNWWSDKSLSWFSYLWNDENQTSVFRSVNSRTTRIPANWKWDIEWTLSYENPNDLNDLDNSNNYNKMDYENSEVFLLYYDRSENNPYTKATDSNLNKSIPEEITWKIRLPKLLKDYPEFWNLDTAHAQVWQKGNLPDDDGIVDRQIRWIYGTTKTPFNIYSTQNIYYDSSEIARNVSYQYDSVFRESDINDTLNFTFWDSNRSPNIDRGVSVVPTIISKSENEIYTDIRTDKYQAIFKNDSFNKIQLRFSLLNLLWSGNYVYPFLEYYTDFWTIVPDKYYTINGEWNFKDYQINTIIQKPTVKETILWSFTSIFW